MKDIIISHIFKSFDGKEVLKDFSATLKEGKTTALMAPSGSGKTTLLRIITGLLKEDSGTLKGLENIKISVVFQEDRLLPKLNPVDNICLANKDLSKEEVKNALSKVGLSNSLDKKTEELSGGMKRRVALLRALMADYDLLLMDEPFRGLDEETKRIVMKDFLERSKGKTVLLVTHDESELKAMGIDTVLTL